jgi:uncharacterized membrane protein YfcA
MPPDIAAVVILFTAALTKAVLGFGEALVAVPLLVLVLDVQSAAPLSALMAMAVTVLMLVRHWRQVDFRATRRLTLGALVGIPLGVWVLKGVPEDGLRAGLGLLLILLGLYYLRRPALPALNGARWGYGFGFAAGLLGGAYNIAGPPVIVYGTLSRWTPQQFRATLQGFFVVINTVILAGHASAGLWTPRVLTLFVLAIPFMLIGFWAGARISQHVPTPVFERLVYIMLVLLGIMLLL